jgi:hypothetical protein
MAVTPARDTSEMGVPYTPYTVGLVKDPSLRRLVFRQVPESNPPEHHSRIPSVLH